MASTIRVRAVASGDKTEVQSLIQHPMDSGFVKDAKGELIPPHHIEVVRVRAQRQDRVHRPVGAGRVEGSLPQVQLQGAKKGDDLKVSWVDNKGGTESLVAKIQ